MATPDAATCYSALAARDERFDGHFFVGVTTTGIYCRPICAARTPRRDRCRFFGSQAAAERAGFRPCLRCRPELAPGRALIDAVPQLVRRALRRIEDGELDRRDVEDLAGALGVTGRHLRRAMERTLGVSPVELAQTRRLATAKRLLQDSALPVGDVALAAGFGSLRRFNALFRARFGCAPTAVRRSASPGVARDGAIALRLDYRPPFDWDALCAFLAVRAIPGVESVDGETYTRVVADGARRGVVRVEPDPERAALRASVPIAFAGTLAPLVAALRAAFDLDAEPRTVASHLTRDPLLAPLVARRPGLRVPGAFDPFETAVRAVLGQQVSVAAARTLAGRLVARYGAPLGAPTGGLTHAFPGAAVLAAAAPDELASIGMPVSRARSLHALAEGVASGGVDLGRGANPADVEVALRGLPGFGPWTIACVLMRALGAPDAFPAGDLGVRRALGGATARAATVRAEGWRPWRAYAVMHLWRACGENVTASKETSR